MFVAAKPAPKPTPSPAPAATPTPAPKPAIPTIVVFPFQTSTDLKPDTGTRAAQLFAQQMNGAGGIDAISAASTIARSDYLNYARKLQADYYLMGYMTPLGAGVSLVEQLVSTGSGTIVYGTTAQIDSFDDASAQAIQIHGAVLSMEQSEADRYNSAQAESTTTPAPANQANLSKGFADIAGLFKHKAATPKPAATTKPSKGVLVVRAGGSVPASDLTRATTVLYSGLSSHFNAKMSSVAATDLTRQADSICGTSRDNTIATGNLSAISSRHGLGTRTQWTFRLDVYTCFGAKLASTPGTGDTLDDAVRSAVDAYATAHPENS
ncbi:MAG TPA: hypothetical protein VGZ02_05700 [Candidatus Baltobacteraceae bacterium]|nr:hypothetical protein [Candidatus Baltobacteraceae bacterium]